MLDEGLYSLDYKLAGLTCGIGPWGAALALLRGGKVLGSDRWGGVFDGDYAFDPADGTNRVRVRMQLPPDGVLVTGYSAGPRGAVLEFDAAFAPARPVATSTVEVEGQPVEVKLSYLGPLPT